MKGLALEHLSMKAASKTHTQATSLFEFVITDFVLAAISITRGRRHLLAWFPQRTKTLVCLYLTSLVYPYVSRQWHGIPIIIVPPS
jgi:hypothetical protein